MVHLYHIFSGSNPSRCSLLIKLIRPPSLRKLWWRNAGKVRYGSQGKTLKRVDVNWLFLFGVRTKCYPRRTIRPWWTFTCQHGGLSGCISTKVSCGLPFCRVTRFEVHHVTQLSPDFRTQMSINTCKRWINWPSSPYTFLDITFQPLFLQKPFPYTV